MKLVSVVGKVASSVGKVFGSLFKLPALPGPQINDIPVQQARDGVPINKVFGITPCVGNVIAQVPPVIVKKKKKKGKGAPKVTQQSILRTFAIGICKGPIYKVLKVWENEKLVADYTEANSLPNDTAAFSAQATFYLGTPTQMPDPELEALFGVGNVPAHRNLAYVVIARRDVSANSGQIPQYRFLVQRPDPNEVAATLSIEWNQTVLPNVIRFFNLGWFSVGNGVAIFQGSIENTVNSDSLLTFNITSKSVTIHTNSSFPGLSGSAGSLFSFFDGIRHIAHSTFFGSPVGNIFTSIDGEIWSSLDTSGFDESADSFAGIASERFVKLEQTYFGFNDSPGPTPSIYRSLDFVNWTLIAMLPFSIWHALPFNGRVVVVSSHGDSPNIAISTDNTLTAWTSYTLPDFVSGPGFPNLTLGVLGSKLFVFARNVDGSVDIAVSDTGFAGSWKSIGTANVGINQPGGFIVVDEQTGNFVSPLRDFDNELDTANALDVLAIAQAIGHDTIASVIKWTADSVGIPTDRRNVDNMQQIVNGLTLGGTYNGAEVIRALQVAGLFDLVQIDGVLKAVKRGGNTVATIVHDDMVASGGDDARKIVRQQRVELTKKLHLEYADPDQDYTTTKETSERRSIDVTTTGEKTVQTPVSLSASEAATLVEKLHRIDWVESAGPATVVVPLKFLKLTPSDPVFVETEQSRLRRMRVSKTSMIDGQITLTLDFDRQSIFSAQVQGTPRLAPPPPVTSIPSATTFEIMDLPALRDSDDQFGIYVAARGNSAWQGAELQVSADAGASWNLVADITTSSVIGTLQLPVTAVRSEWSDLTNSIVIEVTEDDIDDIEAVDMFALLRGGNALHINGEIIQYRDVAQTGPTEFTLSYLIRARLDTTVAAHAIGSKVTLLQDPQFVPLTQSLFGIPLQFRAPAYGTLEPDAVPISITLIGNSVREWIPDSVVAIKSANDYNVTWRNRHRLGTELNPSPSTRMVGHKVTADNGSITRSRDVALPLNNLIYTSAMIVEDFGLPQSALTFSVAPISALDEIVESVVTPPEVAVPRGPVTQFDFTDGGFEAAGLGWVLSAGSPGSLTPTTNPANARTGAGYGQFSRASGALPPAFILGVQDAIVERGTSVSVSGFVRVLQTSNGGNVSAAVWIRLHKSDGSDYVTLIGPFTNFLGASPDYKQVQTAIPVPVPVPVTGEDVLLDAGLVVQSAISDVNMQIDDFVLTAFVLT